MRSRLNGSGAFVPLYFFHVFDDVAMPDEEGTELPDIYTAHSQAITMAGEIMRDLGARFWNGSDWRLEVTDAQGRKLFIVRLSAEDLIPDASSGS